MQKEAALFTYKVKVVALWAAVYKCELVFLWDYERVHSFNRFTHALVPTEIREEKRETSERLCGFCFPSLEELYMLGICWLLSEPQGAVVKRRGCVRGNFPKHMHAAELTFSVTPAELRGTSKSSVTQTDAHTHTSHPSLRSQAAPVSPLLMCLFEMGANTHNVTFPWARNLFKHLLMMLCLTHFWYSFVIDVWKGERLHYLHSNWSVKVTRTIETHFRLSQETLCN